MTDLAIHRNVAASTQNIALNALVFLYRHVLDRPLNEIHGVVRAKKPLRLPVVLTQNEVAKDKRSALAGCLSAIWFRTPIDRERQAARDGSRIRTQGYLCEKWEGR